MGENLTPANMFAVLTILGFLFILPASLLMEGPAKISAAYTASLAAGYTKAQLIRLLGVSGFLYYLYNEVAFLALSEVAPVTHAVANVSYSFQLSMHFESFANSQFFGNRRSNELSLLLLQSLSFAIL